MFRCSLFSTTNNIEQLQTSLTLLNYTKRQYERHEKIYTNSKRNRLIVNEHEKSLVLWESPDTSKDRLTICCKYDQTSIIEFNENFDFSDFGYEFVKEVQASVCEFIRGKIVVEIVTDDDDTYFVHAFVLTAYPSEDEKVLKRCCDELKDVIEFVKQPIQCIYVQ